MAVMTYNQVSVPSFMYGTAWKKEATARMVQLAVESGFTAIDTAMVGVSIPGNAVGGPDTWPAAGGVFQVLQNGGSEAQARCSVPQAVRVGA